MRDQGLMTDALARVVRPIVEGQIRSYLNDHPEIAKAYVGKRRDGKTKVMAIQDSLGKRISRDLLCPSTRVRLAAALLEAFTGAQPNGDVEPATASPARDVEPVAASPSGEVGS